MIKRMTALALALLMLLGMAAACAESSGTRLELTKLRVSLRGSDNTNVVRLKDMTLSVTMGSAEGVPTLQATLDYGEQVDFIAQIVDSRILLSMGGVAGTFYVDLGEALGDAAKGQLMAVGAGAALKLVGTNPDLVLSMWMPKNKNGVNSITLKLPRKLGLALAERLGGLLGDGEVAEEMASSKATIRLKILYRPEKNSITLRLLRGKKGIELKALAEQTTGPAEFINISADEVQYNLLALEDDVRAGLETDLEFMAMKADRFINSVHLDVLADAGAEQ